MPTCRATDNNFSAYFDQDAFCAAQSMADQTCDGFMIANKTDCKDNFVRQTTADDICTTSPYSTSTSSCTLNTNLFFPEFWQNMFASFRAFEAKTAKCATEKDPAACYIDSFNTFVTDAITYAGTALDCSGQTYYNVQFTDASGNTFYGVAPYATEQDAVIGNMANVNIDKIPDAKGSWLFGILVNPMQFFQSGEAFKTTRTGLSTDNYSATMLQIMEKKEEAKKLVDEMRIAAMNKDQTKLDGLKKQLETKGTEIKTLEEGLTKFDPAQSMAWYAQGVRDAFKNKAYLKDEDLNNVDGVSYIISCLAPTTGGLDSSKQPLSLSMGVIDAALTQYVNGASKGSVEYREREAFKQLVMAAGYYNRVMSALENTDLNSFSENLNLLAVTIRDIQTRVSNLDSRGLAILEALMEGFKQASEIAKKLNEMPAEQKTEPAATKPTGEKKKKTQGTGGGGAQAVASDGGKYDCARLKRDPGYNKQLKAAGTLGAARAKCSGK